MYKLGVDEKGVQVTPARMLESSLLYLPRTYRGGIGDIGGTFPPTAYYMYSLMRLKLTNSEYAEQLTQPGHSPSDDLKAR